MTNSPWECTRCGRINAPFNPSCFCKPEEEHFKSSVKTTNSKHITDAARYLNTDALNKILEGEKRKAEIAIGLMPNFYNPRCFICNGHHLHGQQCINLTMS